MNKSKYFIEYYLSKFPPIVITLVFIIIIIGFFITIFPTHIQAAQNNSYITYPRTKFAVISDPHVFETDGNINNPIYLKYGVNDIKLLSLSAEILDVAVQKIIQESKVDFVIIPGDLTDSGDLKSHKAVASILKKLVDKNIKVYVISGNHDGFNTTDFENITIPRDIISPFEFKNIYYNFGYKEAIYEDSESLSYVAEPIEGLWLLMIDSCIYNNEESYHVCNGRIRVSTKKWLNNIFEKAKEEDKALIGVLHHSLLEHYKGQQRYFSKYIVDDFKNLSKEFASQNMKIIFTGHHHAQNIAKDEFEDNSFIYDIETSSLIGFPNAYRIIKINKFNEMIIQSKYVKEIPSYNGVLSNYTKNYVKDKVKNIAQDKLEGFYLNDNDLEKISDKAADAMMAHYQGNENILKDLNIKDLGIWSKFIYSFYNNLITDLYLDPAPNDINIKIDLETGRWVNLGG